MFTGATLGPHAGAVAGLGLIGTYTFYGLVTASASGIFGSAFLDQIGVWNDQPWWSGFLVGAVGLGLALYFAIVPARRSTSILLSVEGITVLLIIAVAVIVLVRLLAGNAPGDASFTLDVFKVAPGTQSSDLFLGIIFGLLSFAGFEAAATLGEEASHPSRDIPRAILGTAIFGGLYFTFVTAVEMMGFGTDSKGVAAFTDSPALMGDLGASFVGAWVGDVITLGAAISAFACCLACIVGASRMIFAVSRDLTPTSPLARTGSNDTPAAAAALVTLVIAAIAVLCAVAFAAKPFDTFFWSGTIGTLILLVAYVLATLGCIKLVFLDRLLPVPMWQVVIPLAALAILGYTIYRNVWPYPTEGPAQWFPVVAFGWLALITIVVLAVPSVPRRLAAGMASFDHSVDSERV